MKFHKSNDRLAAAISLLAAFGLATLTAPQSCGLSSAQAAQGAPQIVSCSPTRGATDVDPALKEITVTFDQDMGEGMSWTGGGPEVPTTPEGKQAHWRDKRTCVLPVKLQSGRHYRVGINSPSHRNFRSAAGVPALTSAVWFTTSGTPDTTKPEPKVPKVVSATPAMGAQDVSPDLKELRVTFNVPMGRGFSWTGGGPEYPTTPEGKKPFWTEDHKTCVLPVELKPDSQYRLGLNSPSYRGFQSAEGVPLAPVGYTFKTGAK
jgi:RNA polymerase sigma-70 factor (ECF subfamily)